MKHTPEEIRIAYGWSRWLPTFVSISFTLLALTIFLGAQSVGALPANAPLAATASRSTIAYQGRLTHANGDTLVTGKKPMIFRLYNTPSDGTALWEEKWEGEQYAIQVVGGQFHVMLGSLTPIPPSVVNGNEALFLAVAVDGDDEMSPRLQLGSMPYAMQALTVPDKSITTAKLADGAVGTAQLAAGAVGTAQIANGAVGTAQIANGTVTKAKLGADVKFTAQTGFGGSSSAEPVLFLPGDSQPRDIPGTNMTITVDTPSTLFVTASFDLVTRSDGGTAVGRIMVNDRYVGRLAVLVGRAHTRATVASSGIIHLDPGTHTLKLRAYSDSSHTTIPDEVHPQTGYTYILLPR